MVPVSEKLLVQVQRPFPVMAPDLPFVQPSTCNQVSRRNSDAEIARVFFLLLSAKDLMLVVGAIALVFQIVERVIQLVYVAFVAGTIL